jgi:hypothetical protein
MTQDSVYYEKYLKYKTKYLELKKSMGGGGKKCNICIFKPEGEKCNGFVPISVNLLTCKCGHSKSVHFRN